MSSNVLLSGHQTDLRLSLVEHVGHGPLQVRLLSLGRVIDVDGVGGAVRQEDVVDGACLCFELGTQQLHQTDQHLKPR